MPGFEPITTSEQLPPEQTSTETLARDFKQLWAGGVPPDRAAVATDVAAFANRIGGVVIVGAVEDRARRVLGKYQSFDAKAAKTVIDECDHAIRDLCSPKPIVDPARIPKGEGFVVAINVWPFPGQAVGVRVGQESAGTFKFPLRAGTHCIYLKPEQLPMLMIPQLRRVVALLYTIPEKARVKVHTQGGGGELELIKVEEIENVVKLQGRLASRSGATKTHHFPLDRITSVWRDDDGVWQIALGDVLAR